MSQSQFESIVEGKIMPLVELIRIEMKDMRKVIMDSSEAIGKIKRENSASSSIEVSIENFASRIEILHRTDSIQERIDELLVLLNSCAK